MAVGGCTGHSNYLSTERDICLVISFRQSVDIFALLNFVAVLLTVFSDCGGGGVLVAPITSLVKETETIVW